MKITLSILLLCLFISQAASAQEQDRNYVSFEYAPWSEHLSNSDAPAGGYNENNDIVTLKLGRMYPINENWSYSLTAGVTAFKNSYDEDSQGGGFGVEWLYALYPEWGLYGGVDLGLVSGYEDHVDNDWHLLGDLIPFMVLNAGAEYEFAPDLPTLRGGLKYVPASIVESDDVMALTIGTRYRF
tara:strand:- start:783 stop:1334 length:552 start_codon:yes stop_codon:yes gene_type:complete